jgi:hypothetical protein
LEQCKKYEPSESEDQSEDEDEMPSEKSVKKVKQDELYGEHKIHTRGASGVPRKINGLYDNEKGNLKKEEE